MSHRDVARTSFHQPGESLRTIVASAVTPESASQLNMCLSAIPWNLCLVWDGKVSGSGTTILVVQWEAESFKTLSVCSVLRAKFARCLATYTGVTRPLVVSFSPPARQRQSTGTRLDWLPGLRASARACQHRPPTPSWFAGPRSPSAGGSDLGSRQRSGFHISGKKLSAPGIRHLHLRSSLMMICMEARPYVAFIALRALRLWLGLKWPIMFDARLHTPSPL